MCWDLDGEAAALRSSDPDFATRDLHEHIKSGGESAWRLSVQIMPVKAAASYRFNVLDITKVLCRGEAPYLLAFLVRVCTQFIARRHWCTGSYLQVWPHTDFPLIPVGRLVLNRNPENYFAEVEQVRRSWAGCHDIGLCSC